MIKRENLTNLSLLFRRSVFRLTKFGGQTIQIDAAYVDARLGELSRDEDLSRYIL